MPFPTWISRLTLYISLLVSLPAWSEPSTIKSAVALFESPPELMEIQVRDQYSHAQQIIKTGNHWQATFLAPDTISVEALLLALRKHPEVISAEKNYPAHLNLTPNDAAFSDSSANISHHSQINSEQAWDSRTDCTSVVVAVVDTGIDEDHPDLINNLWINSDEIADNGIDDDNNGYIDDIHGACVRTDCAASEIEDGFGHGSHVAGLLAAQGNNLIGVSGVCWDAQLMIVKSLGDSGSGNTSDVAAGINYAVNNGADIINTSLTISNFSSAIESAIEQAEQAGILVVAAAGNFDSNNDTSPVYPANFRSSHDNLMAIANVNDTSSLHVNSNYGTSSVDMAAPGVGLFSTWKEAQYANSTGTSMSAPLVAATAALMLAEQTQSDLSLKAGLLSTGNSATDLEWKMVSPKVLDANNALSNVNNTPLALFRAEANSGSYQLFGFDLGNVDTVQYTEPLTSGEQITRITSFTNHSNSSLQVTLPATSKSGIFTLFRGTERSNPIFVKRLISAPDSLSFNRSDTDLTLSWNNPQNADLIRIERGIPGGAFQEIAILSTPNSVYQDTIDTNQRYYYRLRGSYDYIDPASNSNTTEYSTYSTTIISSEQDNEGFTYWLTDSLPSVGLNTEVILQLTASSSGSYQLASGALPTGLTLSSSGEITGTVSEIDDFNFIVNFQPTNSNQIDSKAFTMSVTDSASGTMQLIDQQSLSMTVSASSGTLSSVQALVTDNFDSLNGLSVQLIQQVLISNLPISAAETSEISLSLNNATSGQLNEIYLANNTNQWQSSDQTSNTQLSANSASILIEDGGEYDLDNQVNGEIVARIASVSVNNTTASDSNSNSDSRCFIASSVYPAGHDDLSTFRSFRDNILKPLPGGDSLVNFYYQSSPKLVAWMSKHPQLLEITRTGLETTATAIRHPFTMLFSLLTLLGIALIARQHISRRTMR